jgi:hypothetical protein
MANEYRDKNDVLADARDYEERAGLTASRDVGEMPNVEWQTVKAKGGGKVFLHTFKGSEKNSCYIWRNDKGVEHVINWSGSDSVDAQAWLKLVSSK